ncbi:FIG00470756: hypothetical protein [hydrothermal vent metagenome]|uniref:Uncharacterized protein n=1 Tax=hydrothermal vent metagenome TaxID=652676 RepID=A0A1W1EFZ5_9ZZZZ
MFLKKKSSKQTVKNIVTLNAYTNKKYIFKNDTYQPLNKLSYNTSNFIASYIANKDLITASVKLSRSILNEDIADILEIKAYEELGLDQATNYMISHTEVQGSGEEREFNLFVTQPESLDELFLPVKEETKYVDLIVPAPLLYNILYKKEILSPNGTHAFIYFTEQDAFIAFYKDGEFLYSKSLEYSLEHIYDKYCELVGEKVDEKEFFTIFESEGLKSAKSEYQQNFMKIFSEVFITINDIVIYAKRAFQLDTVDQLFIGSVRGPIIGLDEYSQNYLGLQSSDLNFNYNIKNDEWYTDQLQCLLLLNSFEYMENEDAVVNLTMYPRPPSFTNRASGQFIIATFAAVSLGLAYPLIYLVGSYVNNAKIYALDIESNQLKTEAQKYKKIISAKRETIKGLNDQIGKVSKVYAGKTKTLTAIYNKKVNYRLKSGTFYNIADSLNKFDVYVDSMYTDNDTIYLSIVSTDDRKFTEVIQYISDTYFSELKQIDIELIKKDPVSKYYKGLLKVVLK